MSNGNDAGDMGFNFTSWTDLRKFDNVNKEGGNVDIAADADWYTEEEKVMTEKHGGDFIKVSWGKDQVDYFCTLCNVHSNSRLTTNMHCDGMKHLKKKKMWENEQNPDIENQETGKLENNPPAPSQPEKPPSKRKEPSKDYRDQWNRLECPKNEFPYRNRGFNRGGREGPFGRDREGPFGRDREGPYGRDREGAFARDREGPFGRGRGGSFENRRFLDRMEPEGDFNYKSRSPPRNSGRSRSPMLSRMSRSPLRQGMSRSPPRMGQNPSLDGRMYSDRMASSSSGAREILPGRFRNNFEENSNDMMSQMRVPSPPKVEFKANRLSSLERLANLSVFSEEDAKIALNVVSSLMNSLKVYYQAKSNLKVLDMLIQAQLKVGLIAAQVEPTPAAAVRSETDYIGGFSRQEKPGVKSIPRF